MSIPDEMIVEISKYADGSTLFNLLLINESINFLISSDQCWYERIILAFPGAKNAMSELMKFMSLPHIYLSHLRYKFYWENDQYIPCFPSPPVDVFAPTFMTKSVKFAVDSEFLEYDDVDIFKYYVDKTNLINNTDVMHFYFAPILVRGCQKIILYVHSLNIPFFDFFMVQMVNRMIVGGLSATDYQINSINTCIKVLNIILQLHPNSLDEFQDQKDAALAISDMINNKLFVQWLNTRYPILTQKVKTILLEKLENSENNELRNRIAYFE